MSGYGFVSGTSGYDREGRLVNMYEAEAAGSHSWNLSPSLYISVAWHLIMDARGAIQNTLAGLDTPANEEAMSSAWFIDRILEDQFFDYQTEDEWAMQLRKHSLPLLPNIVTALGSASRPAIRSLGAKIAGRFGYLSVTELIEKLATARNPAEYLCVLDGLEGRQNFRIERQLRLDLVSPLSRACDIWSKHFLFSQGNLQYASDLEASLYALEIDTMMAARIGFSLSRRGCPQGLRFLAKEASSGRYADAIRYQSRCQLDATDGDWNKALEEWVAAYMA